MWTRIGSLLFCLFLVIPAGAQTDVEETWGFAVQLLGRGDYYESVGELKRFIYVSPSNSGRASAEILIALCYYRGKQYAACDQACQRFCAEHSTSPLLHTAQLLSLLSQSAPGTPAEELLSFAGRVGENEPARQSALYIAGWALARSGDWASSRSAFRSAAESKASTNLASAAANMAGVLDSGPPLDLRSVQSARRRSRLLPGLGQAYCGTTRDAVSALLLGSICAYGAVKWWESGFETGATFLVYQGLLRFYKGNIYNATVQAIEHNASEIDKRLQPYAGLEALALDEIARTVTSRESAGWIAGPGQ